MKENVLPLGIMSGGICPTLTLSRLEFYSHTMLCSLWIVMRQTYVFRPSITWLSVPAGWLAIRHCKPMIWCCDLLNGKSSDRGQILTLFVVNTSVNSPPQIHGNDSMAITWCAKENRRYEATMRTNAIPITMPIVKRFYKHSLYSDN